MRKIVFVPDDAVLNFKLRGRGAYIDDLVRHLHELIEIQRPVVERARKPKAVFDEHGFARFVAFIHAADLRDGGVRFIDNDQKIPRKKIDDGVRLRSRQATGQMPRIIFDAITEAHFLKHFEIVLGAHAEPLRFEKFVLRLERFDPVFQLGANGTQSAV